MENIKHEVILLSFISILLLSSINVTSVYAEQIVKPTDKGHINIGFSTDPENPNPGDQTLLNVNFINKQGTVQHHIDYRISVMQGENLLRVFTSHTEEGSVSLPFQFENNGTYKITVEVDGVLFQPVPPEAALFTLRIGSSVPEFPINVVIVLLVAVTSIVLISRIKLRIGLFF